MFFKKLKKRLKENAENFYKMHEDLEKTKKEYDDYLNSSKSNFLSCLIGQVGDLIHYQSNDYKKEFPKDSIIYSYIGTILRSMYKAERNYMSVSELIEKENSSISRIPNNILNPIKDFNAVMLVDLTSRMQGMNIDNCYLDAFKFIQPLKTKVEQTENIKE